MAGVITASEQSWIAPFTGLSARSFGKPVTALRREGADPVRKGRPWSLPLEDRVLLVAAYWRTNLTMRQLAPLFGVSKSAADRIIDQLSPSLALQPRKRFAKDTVLIVDGTLVPTRDHAIAEQSKNYRYSTNHQAVIDADTRLVVVVGRPLPGNRNDCKAWEESGAKAAVGRTMTIADGGYPGTGLVMPHRRRKGEELPDWKQAHNKSHKQVRARVEHVFARMKTWKILRDCRLKGVGVHHAMLGIARLHNLTSSRASFVRGVSPPRRSCSLVEDPMSFFCRARRLWMRIRRSSDASSHTARAAFSMTPRAREAWAWVCRVAVTRSADSSVSTLVRRARRWSPATVRASQAAWDR